MTEMKRWLLALSAVALCVVSGLLIFRWRFRDELGADPENLLTMRSGDKIYAFTIKDQRGMPLWLLCAKQPRGLSRLTHGVVPTGFRQEVPAVDQRPRLFADGEEVRTEIQTERYIFTHECTAEAGVRLRCGHYEWNPRSASGSLCK